MMLRSNATVVLEPTTKELSHMSAPRPEDMRAGYTGLIVAVVLIAVIVMTVVTMTNRHFEEERAHAEASVNPDSSQP